MLWFLGNRACVIGVDLSNDSLKMVQLANSGKGIRLIAGRNEDRPESVQPGSAGWQRWAVEAMREATADGKFRGKEIMAAIPPSDVFIDHIKIGLPFYDNSRSRKAAKANDEKVPQAVFSKIKQKLPFQLDDAMIRYIPTEQDDALVVATDRKVIDRHLAIYEKAGLTIKSISIWPMALVSCYTKFFGRRKADLDAVVMLLDIQTSCTNVVICRYKKLLYACSIPIGASGVDDEKVLTRLVLELTACRRHFVSMHQNAQMQRLIFLSGPAVSEEVYRTIAKQLEIQAQMGDCLAAVDLANPSNAGIDRRDCHVNWAIAFGLSLS
jgi:Tfp pilus assembly PilM family ATPase